MERSRLHDQRTTAFPGLGRKEYGVLENAYATAGGTVYEIRSVTGQTMSTRAPAFLGFQFQVCGCSALTTTSFQSVCQSAASKIWCIADMANFEYRIFQGYGHNVFDSPERPLTVS